MMYLPLNDKYAFSGRTEKDDGLMAGVGENHNGCEKRRITTMNSWRFSYG